MTPSAMLELHVTTGLHLKHTMFARVQNCRPLCLSNTSVYCSSAKLAFFMNPGTVQVPQPQFKFKAKHLREIVG